MNATLRLLGCLLAALLVVTFASSASFADEPAPPGDDSSTGESTEPAGDTENEDGGTVEGNTSVPETDAEVSRDNGAITEGGSPVGQTPVEVEGGADVRIIKNGGISVGGADVIEGDPVVGEITGVLTSKADESGRVAYEVHRFTAPTTFISSLSTIRVNVLARDGQDAAADAANDDSADSVTAALPEAGASRSMKPALAAGLYFTIAGLIVVGATRPYEIFVPVPRTRRPRVNWE
ncbi:MAG: hypothetical protein WAL70_04890 [Aeromicrobium sp.]